MGISQSKYIYDSLLNLIVEGDLNLGDKLPTEMQLCKQYDVSRSTIREALSMLAAKGFVEVRRGSGAYIKSKDVNTEENVLVIDKIDNLADFMEIRTSFETLAVRLFIKQFTIDNFERLEEVESLFEKAVHDNSVKNMAMYDEMFHRTIFEGTNNALLINIGEVLSSAFALYRVKTFENVEHRKDAIKAHRLIVGSLGRKDTNEAIINMHNHLSVSYENAIK